MNENTHSVHRTKTKFLWKADDVGEEELTKDYLRLVVTPQMGQGIMPNTDREIQGI